MNVLGINGSPRKNGNVSLLLDKALSAFKKKGANVFNVFLNDLDIKYCQEDEYENINNNGFSIINDDMHLIYKKIEESNIIIIGSPVFFGTISGQLKTMIDRFQCIWLAKNIFNKNIFNTLKFGAFICVGAVNNIKFFDNSKSIIKHFFSTINVEYKKELFCYNVEKKGIVKKNPILMEQAFLLGENLLKESENIFNR